MSPLPLRREWEKKVSFAYHNSFADISKHWRNADIGLLWGYAPVVKWISHRSSEPILGVQVPPGAQKDLEFSAISFRIVLTRVSFSGRTRPCQGRGGSSILPTRILGNPRFSDGARGACLPPWENRCFPDPFPLFIFLCITLWIMCKRHCFIKDICPINT